MFVLAKVLGNRVLERVRNEQGLTYTAQGDHAPSQAFPGFGFLYAMVDAPPGQGARSSRRRCRAIGAAIYRDGITEDELERARNPLVSELKRLLQTNGYLLSAIVSGSQEQPGEAQARHHQRGGARIAHRGRSRTRWRASTSSPRRPCRWSSCRGKRPRPKAASLDGEAGRSRIALRQPRSRLQSATPGGPAPATPSPAAGEGGSRPRTQRIRLSASAAPACLCQAPASAARACRSETRWCCSCRRR